MNPQTSGGAAMVDVVFPLHGRMLPHDHHLGLAQALVAALPCLADDCGSAIHPVRLVDGEADATGRALLSARARLLLRVRRERLSDVGALRGRLLDIEGCTVSLGDPQARELLPHGTLYAAFVDASDADEPGFLATARGELERLGVEGEPICGRAQRRSGPQRPLHGYSLMLHGLRTAASLRLLEHGLGAHRLLGCGVFVPHRSAAAVGGGP
jgi:CRISPR-associated protein Cas6